MQFQITFDWQQPRPYYNISISRRKRIRRVDRQTFLPSFRELLFMKTSKFFSFLVKFLRVFLEQFIPLLLMFSALGSSLMIKIINLIRNNKTLLRIKATTRQLPTITER